MEELFLSVGVKGFAGVQAISMERQTVNHKPAVHAERRRKPVTRGTRSMPAWS